MPAHERVFGEQFAEKCSRTHGIACSSGTAALTAALQALGIGPGDEVVVPGLTWVACASAVLHLGARPVFADIGADSLCCTPETIRPLIGSRTAAVLGVHMYSSRADLEGLERLCADHDCHLIEDASQAHGATLNGRQVGSFGILSVFSFQQSKLLTGGEGGIVLTDDEDLYSRLQQLRADGRVYGNEAGFWELAVGGGICGRNMVMSEFAAVLLREGMERLEQENRHRRTMAQWLRSGLADLGWCQMVEDGLPPEDGRTHYKIPLRIRHTELNRLGPERLATILSADLCLPVEPLDRPLPGNPLYQPQTIPLIQRLKALAPELSYEPRDSLPRAKSAWDECVTLPHQCLLGGEPEVMAILAALRRMERHADALVAAGSGGGRRTCP